VWNPFPTITDGFSGQSLYNRLLGREKGTFVSLRRRPIHVLGALVLPLLGHGIGQNRKEGGVKV